MSPYNLLYPGPVSGEVFDRLGDEIIWKYFRHPPYWKIDGKPYFSIYELMTLGKGLGGIDPTRKALDNLREKALKAGPPGLHFNAVV